MQYKKLYQVSLSLSKLGLNWKIKEYESYETKKTIVMVIPNIDHKQKVIHKTTLNKLSDRITPSTTFIANSMYCYEEDLEKTKAIIHADVFYHIIKFKSDVDQLYLHVELEKENEKITKIN